MTFGFTVFTAACSWTRPDVPADGLQQRFPTHTRSETEFTVLCERFITTSVRLALDAAFQIDYDKIYILTRDLKHEATSSRLSETNLFGGRVKRKKEKLDLKRQHLIH